MKTMRTEQGLMLLGLWTACLLSGCAQEEDLAGELTGHTIEVVYQGETVSVDTGSVLQTDRGDGELGVLLSDLLSEALPEADLATLGFDFESSDGFRPGSRLPCKGSLPVPYDKLAQGYFMPLTGSLWWDEGLGFGGCLYVEGIERIYVLHAAESFDLLLVGEGEQAAQVDLRTLPVVQVEEGDLVSLSVIVSAVVDSAEDFVFDLEDGLGHRPGRDLGLSQLSYTELQGGFLKLSDHSVLFTDEGDPGDDWHLAELSRIIPEVVGETARVTVMNGADSHSVDLGTLELVDWDGDDWVSLAAVLAASSLTAVEDLSYTLVAADGFDPTVDKGAVPLTYQTFSMGFIHPVTRSVQFPLSAEVGGYWNVDDVAQIRVISME